MIGQSAKGNGPLLEDDDLYATEARDARARPGAREAIVTDGDGVHDTVEDDDAISAMDEVVELWVQQAKATLRRLGNWPGRDSGFLAEHPASLHDLLSYAKRAPMAGGSPLLRGLQCAHCFLIAIPASLALYATAWLLQRPLRSVCFLLFAVVIWRLH